MGWKNGNRLGKNGQGTTTNMKAYRCSGEMRMVYKISSENSGRRAWWRRCGKTVIDTAVEEMHDRNIRNVGQRRRKNGSE